MQYQISCFSPRGHVRTLARAFAAQLNVPIDDLEAPVTPRAPIQLVGFELEGADPSAIPLRVMEHLDALAGKTIFLFATTPFRPTELIQNSISRAASPFLPEPCDYRGIYICAAQPDQELLEQLRARCDQAPDNQRSRHWLAECESAQGHPDEEDLRRGLDFARHVLKWEEA